MFWVYGYAVPSPQAAIARQFVSTEVIPQFIAWASRLIESPTTSTIRRAVQHFTPDMSTYPADPTNPDPGRHSTDPMT